MPVGWVVGWSMACLMPHPTHLTFHGFYACPACSLSCAVSSTKLIGTGHLRVLPKPDKNAATKAVAADLSSVM